MPRDSHRHILRNNAIRENFRQVRKKNPKWTIVAVIEDVADTFYLSPSTVTSILKQMDEKVPAVDTIAKYTRPVQQNLLF
ncbi:MAG: hypothetical protein ACTHK8_18955 [Ginsengibacter sp.]